MRAVSKKRPSLTENVMMALAESQPDPLDPQLLERIRARLLTSTRSFSGHVPAADAEDVVQDALARYAREPTKPGVSDETRARTAQRRARANYYRTRARRPAVVDDALEDLQDPVLIAKTGPDEAFIQALVAIEQIAGLNVRRLVELRAEGYTLDAIGRLDDWSPQSVAAAYKQLARRKSEIAASLALLLQEDEYGTD